MARYKILIKPSAVKEIESIPNKKDRQRIVAKISRLADNPRPPGCEKLTGEPKYSVRQGRYRIVYMIEDQDLLLYIYKVGHRKDIYRWVVLQSVGGTSSSRQMELGVIDENGDAILFFSLIWMHLYRSSSGKRCLSWFPPVTYYKPGIFFVRGELLFINDQNRKWFILAAASCAFGLVRIDETVAAVALSTIQHDLSMSRVLTHWVINSYLTVLAGFVAVGGELSDITGYRKLFITLSVGCF